MLIRDSDIPGFRAAVKRENDIRDAAFLDLTTRIGGVEIHQLTPRDLLILDGLDNPLVSGGVPSPAQLAHFLWLLSPFYVEHSKLRRWKFARSVRKLNFVTTVQACWKFMDDTFQDSPGGSGPTGTPFAGWCAYLVDRLSSNYGWSESEILQTPLKKLFQYIKVIRARTDADYSPHNPSDKLKREGALAIYHARTALVNTLQRRANS